jgi:hypothetical protein
VIDQNVHMPRESTEYVFIPVLTSGPVNPTAYPVRMAFTADGSGDRPVTLLDAEWDTLDGIPYAKLLVGPGGETLAPGRWIPWWKVSANPEQPVRPATNMLIIT